MSEEQNSVPGQEASSRAETIRTKIEAIDGETLVEMFEGAAGWLEHHVPHINALNVFPVPDGDTGTNMMLTVQSAVKEVRKLTAQEREAVAAVASKMARGALMGARGNSGVILSQILRGFATALEEKERATVPDLVKALEQATEAGYKAVMKPVEGTILTVIREAATAARTFAKNGHDGNVLELFERVVKAAREAELRTPELLPVLKEAGVTDSGGHGLWIFLDGAWRRLKGEEIEATHDVDSAEIEEMISTVGHPQPGEALAGEWGYDIQYLIKARPGNPLDVNAIREHISRIGECPLVVGDEQLVKVHVHCPNPGPPIEYGANQGSISDVVVEDMDAQAEEFLQETQEEQPAPKTPTKSTEEVAGIGIVAVAPGEGLAEVFRSLGVSRVVSGGQTMNPSTQDLLDAAEAVKADTVIILPNNKNVIMAASQVPELAPKNVHVLPTRTVPQGIAAVMSFNYAGDLEDNLAAMLEAIEHVQTGEVTTAVRTTTINDVSVQEGDIIGMLNGQLVIADEELEAVVRALLERIDLDEYEITTFYYGQNISVEEAQNIIDSLAEEYSMLEMELIPGGQPHYHFIFSVE
ncbi:MAG: DAK2 domain-containing protein [Chloroflexota bacterium]|nr:DAK2 domain-containing protein [Chloroflexota bacterium]